MAFCARSASVVAAWPVRKPMDTAFRWSGAFTARSRYSTLAPGLAATRAATVWAVSWRDTEAAPVMEESMCRTCMKKLCGAGDGRVDVQNLHEKSTEMS